MGPLPPSSDASGKALPRAFSVFWAGQGLSALGDAMTVVALPLVVLAQTGSVADMGRLTAFARTGGLLATALAGFVVDRLRPRRVMLACDLFRCALMGLIPLALLVELRAPWLVFVVGVGAALAQGIFYVGHVSLVAEIVGRVRVSLANSRIEGTIALSFVFGPLAAGALSARFGPATVLGVDAATFFVSALTLLSMGRGDAPALETPAPQPRATWTTGFEFIRGQPELARLSILVALYQLCTAAVVDLFIFRLKHQLGQGDSGVGLTFAVASAAAVAAATLTPRLRAKLSFHRLWSGALVLQGLALAATAASHSWVSLAAAAAIYMSVMTTLTICHASVRQELTPQHLLGRVTSAFVVLVTLPAPMGALAATALAERFGPGPVQAGTGVGLLMTAACAAFIWSRSRSRSPTTGSS